MAKTMKDLHDANLNSVLVSVSWEIIEPKEGIFDFTSVDELIRVARENDMKLGILWFGTWKNGLSPYAPVWVIRVKIHVLLLPYALQPVMLMPKRSMH